MPLNIGKINLGISSKKNHFDWSHDVNTTSDFGFCQPTLIKSLIPNTKINLRTKTFTRLAPLPAPLFGRISLKQYTQFIPMNEVFPGFSNMQNQTSIRTSIADYIPTEVDHIRNDKFLSVIFRKSLQNYTDFVTHSPQDYSSSLKWWLNTFFTVGINISDVQELGALGNVPSSDYGDWYGKYSKDFLDSNAVNSTLSSNVKTFLSLPSTYKLTNGQILTCLLIKNVIKSKQDHSFSSFGETVFGSVTSALGNSDFSSYLQSIMTIGETLDSSSVNQYDKYFNYHSTLGINSTLYKLVKPVVNVPRSADSSDFVFVGSNVSVELPNDDFTDSITRSCKVSLCLRLTPQGKRFFKILNAAGINFGIQKEIEIPKLIAYYKAWFDQMNTGRLLDWKMTNAYKLIHTYYDCGYTLSQLYADTSLDIYGQKDTFVNFLFDLSKCFYTLPVDPITVATPTQYQVNSANDVNVLLSDAEHSYTIANTGVGNSVHSDTDNILSSLQVHGLLRLQKVLNKDGVIGKIVDNYLHTHFGYTLEKTNFIGKNEFMCDVSDVLGTVNNDETQLGEYAGKGIGSGSTDKMTFETDDFGYLIQFTCIVPLGGYVQASQPVEINRLDFYRSEYDSLGMENLPMSEVLSRQFCFKGRIPTDKVFGWRPRFFSKKYVNNVNNGDFAFPSQRTSFLPYNLDRIFTETTPTTDVVKLASDDSLRTIGQYEFLGNYNRIFYDTTGTVDNFIIHIVHDFHVYSPMKAIANSFDAFDPETDNDTTTVVHQ